MRDQAIHGAVALLARPASALRSRRPRTGSCSWAETDELTDEPPAGKRALVKDIALYRHRAARAADQKTPRNGMAFAARDMRGGELDGKGGDETGKARGLAQGLNSKEGGAPDQPGSRGLSCWMAQPMGRGSTALS
jgi:hypothetical protein